MERKQKKLNALIVEDDEQDARLMILELETTGRLTTHRRVDSESGLLAALDEGSWDIVLSDFSLPRLDAFKVLAVVKGRRAHLPVVVVSGVVGEETAVELIKKGASDFVLKDRMTRLPALIERLLAEVELAKERETAANALAEAESLSELLFASVSEVAIIILKADGEIVRWSRGAEMVFGFSALEAIGQNIEIIYTEADRASGQSQKECETATRDGKAEDVRCHVRKDGERIFCDGVVSPLCRKNGSLIGFAKVARNITEKKRLQDEREEMLREAMRTSRMKDEFLTTLSHELRTPLNAIVGYADLLCFEEPGGEYFHQSLNAIRRNAHAQTQLIEDLLDISRIITGKMVLNSAPVHALTFIDTAIEAVTLSAKAKGVQIRRFVEHDVPPVLGDVTRLIQAIWNLLTNAIKFTPKGGLVTVKLRRLTSSLEIEVVDTGCGIAREFLPHVFERFRQEHGDLNRKFGGLGLGLAIVRHVVEAHGGTVQVDSAGVSQGTQFVINLPSLSVANEARHHESVESVENAEFGIAPASVSKNDVLKGKTVLVIDDHADARELVTRILKRAGADTRTAESGSDAMRVLQSVVPDFIICDIGMPDVDGYEVIRRIRATCDKEHSIPALALTAFARPEDARRALEAGFSSHLSKPVEPSTLVRTVAELLAK